MRAREQEKRQEAEGAKGGAPDASASSWETESRGGHIRTGDRREGDWDCYHCGTTVFAWRRHCPKCYPDRQPDKDKGKGKQWKY